MEEEKKEDGCCGHKHGHHHKCCGRKTFILILAGLFIFSLGICFGAHCNYNREGRGERSFNFEQKGGRQMMNRSFSEKQGGCQMQNSDAPKECGCQGQNQATVSITPSAAIKNIAPVTPIK